MNALKQNQKEVTLTLKKRPHHINVGPPGNRRKNKLKQAMFPSSMKRRNSDKRSSRKSDYLVPPQQPYIEARYFILGSFSVLCSSDYVKILVVESFRTVVLIRTGFNFRSRSTVPVFYCKIRKCGTLDMI